MGGCGHAAEVARAGCGDHQQRPGPGARTARAAPADAPEPQCRPGNAAVRHVRTDQRAGALRPRRSSAVEHAECRAIVEAQLREEGQPARTNATCAICGATRSSIIADMIGCSPRHHRWATRRGSGPRSSPRAGKDGARNRCRLSSRLAALRRSRRSGRGRSRSSRSRARRPAHFDERASGHQCLRCAPFRPAASTCSAHAAALDALEMAVGLDASRARHRRW